MQTSVSTAGAALALHDGEATPRDALRPGDRAGPWLVERELGRGGMGAVYAVVHAQIGKRAALKVMHARLAIGGSDERILLEARVVNQVAHPNIVDIFGTGALPDGRPYIVMERLAGVPLGARADDGKLLPDQVIAVLLEICDALIAAHAAGVIHRDLKLDNVFLVDNADDPAAPRVKLLDWGIAKVTSIDTRHTQEGQLVGTPQYLAPELARGAAVSPKTDVYSLGVMAYELFVEQLPFHAETAAELMAMHMRAAPPPPSQLWSEIPTELERLLLAMLAKDPDARPSMRAVAHALERVRPELRHRCVASEPRASTPREPRRSIGELAPTRPARRWRAARMRRAALGATALAASALLFVLSRPPDRPAVAPRAGVPAAAGAHAPPRDDDLPRDAALVLPGERSAPVPAALVPAAPLDPSAPYPAGALGAAPLVSAIREGSLVRPAPPREHASPKPLVEPRRGPRLDPDGTLEPYL